VTTDRKHIDVGGIAVEVVHKPIKNLYVGVYPPNGRVRVAAPLRLDDEAVRLAVVSRLKWIRRQQAGFTLQDRQSEREMVTGESHYYQGRRYLLDVIDHEGPPTVRIVNNTTMQLRIRAGADRDRCDAALQKWYRGQLKNQLPSLVAKWEQKAGVSVAEVRIKKMKTRWGSCKADAGRIWLNLELAKKPASCLEYILVHEIVHLFERHHTERFRDRMDALMPTWRIQRQELMRAPLAHEEWRY
jgi:predicted metal-dependent hydrolase